MGKQLWNIIGQVGEKKVHSLRLLPDLILVMETSLGASGTKARMCQRRMRPQEQFLGANVKMCPKVLVGSPHEVQLGACCETNELISAKRIVHAFQRFFFFRLSRFPGFLARKLVSPPRGEKKPGRT